MSEAVLNLYEQLTSARYGAMELKRFVGPNLIKGLVVSFLVHFGIIIAPAVVKLFQGEELIPPPNVVVIDASKLTKLKRQQDDTQQQVQIAQPKMEAPAAAIPIAVDEDIVDAEPMIAKQQDLAAYLSSDPNADAGLDFKPGDVIEIKDDLRDPDEIPSAGTFVPFEVAPQPLADFAPVPKYPDLAKDSGVKGLVIVQCYVDKSGIVKKFLIKDAKPANLGFEEEVEKVIMKWKFTPAIQNGKPIGVWVEIPFTFDT